VQRGGGKYGDELSDVAVTPISRSLSARVAVELEQQGINSPIIIVIYHYEVARRVPVYFLDWIDLCDGISPFVCRRRDLIATFFFLSTGNMC